MAVGDLAEAIARLRAAHGLDFARTRRLLCLLADGDGRGDIGSDIGGGLDVSGLVALTGASRRRVEEVLGALHDWLRRDGDSDGAGWRVAPAHTTRWREAAGCADLRQAGFGPPDLTRSAAAGLLERMREAAAGLPAPVTDLDHVPATAETALRRAYALAANYDLAGRRVVCLGDHDLTSVALGLVDPSIDVSVVDIDDEMLGYLDRLAVAWRLPVRTYFADLRVELPPGLRDGADLVFTDPPYTPAGIELFLVRAICALRRVPGARILFCYSPSDRQLARGLRVQQAVTRLQLVVEAMLPEFNVFTGAESIGGRSTLWICQPGTNAWAAAQRGPRSTAIYTRGRQAEETSPGGGTVALLRERTGSADAEVLAADGVEALLRAEPPAGQGGSVRPESTVLADLTGLHPSYAYRLLLRTRSAARVVLAVDAPVRLEAPPWRLLGCAYRMRVEPDGGVVVVDALRRAAADLPEFLWTARYVLDHPRARLAGAWREALVAAARRRGGAVSKNEARRAIAEVVDPHLIEGRYLGELPGHTLEVVARALVGTAGAVGAGAVVA